MRNKFRVLMIVENMPVPADSRVWPEAIALRDSGFQVTVICPKGPANQGASHEIIGGICIYRYDAPAGHSLLSYLLEFLVALFQTFRLSLLVLLRGGFDVIHAANPPDLFFLLALFYRVLGKRFIFDQHEIVPELFRVRLAEKAGSLSGRLLGRILLTLEWCSYQVADVVLVVNESLRQIAVTRGGCSPDKVVVVRNAPDLRMLPQAVACSNDGTPHPHVLAYVGVMGVQDGVEYALYALHQLVTVRGRSDVSLLFMGDGGELPTLKRLAQNLEIERYVTFTGMLPLHVVYHCLATAEIGLSPDPKNGLNEYCTMVKCTEYMGMRLPIVAFDLLETRNMCDAAALYASPNSVVDYVDKLEFLLDNEAVRSEMGLLGRRRVEQEWNWQVSSSRLTAVYRSLFAPQLN